MGEVRVPKSARSRRRTLIVSAIVGVAAIGAIGGGTVAVASGTPFSAGAAASDPGAFALDQCSAQLQQALGVERATGKVQIQLEALTSDGQQSTLIASEDASIWCQGESKNLGWILIDSPWHSFPDPAKDAVLVGPRTQDVSEGGKTFVLGRAGSDVHSVAVVVGGEEVPATLKDSWWTASWATGAESELDNAVVIFTVSDGSSQKSLLNDLVVGDKD